MELVQLNAEQIGLMTFATIGVVELINRLRGKDYWVVTSIVTAGIVSALLSLYWGVDVVLGTMVGLGGSGLLKTLSIFGNKSTPTPSAIINKG